MQATDEGKQPKATSQFLAEGIKALHEGDVYLAQSRLRAALKLDPATAKQELLPHISKLEQRNGKSPTEHEISAEMGLGIDQYQSMLGDVKCSQLLYYEDFADDDSASFLERYLVDGSNDPLAVLEDEGFRGSLVSAIHHLPEFYRVERNSSNLASCSDSYQFQP